MWHERHRNLFLAWAEEIKPLAWGTEPRPVIDRLVVEHDNFRAALAWSLGAAEGDDGGLRLVHALHPLWQCSGHMREGRRWMEAFLTRGSTDDALVLSVTRRAGILASESNDHNAATLLSPQALALARDLRDRPDLLSRSMMTAGWIAGAQGDLHTERCLMDEALTLARAHDMPFEGECMSLIAYLAYRQARYGEARQMAQEVLANHADCWIAVSNANHTLGRIEREQGNLVKARQYLERHASMDAGAGQAWSVHASCELGDLAWAVGDRAAARSYYERVLELGPRQASGVTAALIGLAELASAEGEHDHAVRLANKVAARTDEIGDVDETASVLNRLGDVRALAGELDAADGAYRRALSLAHRNDMWWHLAASLEGFAFLGLVRGQPVEAARLLGAAGAVRSTINAPPPRTVLPSIDERRRAATATLGAEQVEMGRGEGARDVAALVTRHMRQHPTVTPSPRNDVRQ